MNTSLEKILQDGKLLRQVNDLIVAHLHDNNLNLAIIVFASATMTPSKVESPPNKLIESCVQGLALERDEVFRGVAPAAAHVDFGLAVIPAGYRLVPHLCCARYKRASKSFPKHETRHVSEHKNVARCARFSPDGRYVVTISVDTSIKLFEISKIKQMMLPNTRDGQVRPIKRIFYDHLHDFHHQSNILISGAKYLILLQFRFFDFSKTSAKIDNHNVRSVSFHPSGEFLLLECGTFPWTDHSIPHLYDISTIQYDAMTIWDGVTAQSVHSRVGAQGSAEATSLWEVDTRRLVKQYVGATHTQLHCQPSNPIGAPLCLEYSPTESAFISCGTDRSSRLWKETL
ncbi:hypothetical protein MKW92_043676 [Papaver armeniacum]|nr:hypothetical protein MKW92_043676 [Papaver armeniacum]